nr:transglutaminase-like domain-containing protein [uncultured Anaerotignum sp.]
MKKQLTKNFIIFSLTGIFLLSGCGTATSSDSSAEVTQTTETEFPEEMYTQVDTIEEALAETPVPLAGNPTGTAFQTASAPGTVVYSGNKDVTIDASNTSKGYVMIKCAGSDAKLKVIITGPSGVKYTYNLNNNGNYETFVLSDGNGTYQIGVYENISGTKYSVLLTQQINVSLENEFVPFLCPNQYVNFNENSQVVALAKSLTAGKTNDLDKVQAIYNYVIKNISYDTQKAQTVQSGYLPNVDEILKTKKGICFDYAAVMTAMLRSQNIPTKLVVGYTGSAYHAWISTYTPETGWVEGIIFFDGVSWKLMDPTFASSANSSDAIMKYIGDGKNYTEKFLY